MSEEFTIRASSMQRIALCPGSENAIRKVIPMDEFESKANKKMRESGDRVHYALERLFKGERDLDAIVEPLEEGEEITFWTFRKHALPIIGDHGGASHIAPEDYLNIGWLTGHRDLRVLCEDGTTHIFDWKAGQGEQIPAWDNLQGRSYVVLEVEKNKPTGDVYFHLLSAEIGTDEPFTTTCYKPDHFEPAKNEIRGYYKNAAKKDAPRCVGFMQCQYCPAAGKASACPESVELIHDLVKTEPPVVDIDNLTTEQKLAFVNHYELLKAAEKIIAEQKRMMKAVVMMHGIEKLEGFTIVRGGTTKSIEDPMEVYKIGLEEGWFTQQEFMRIINIKLKDLNDLAYKNKADWTQKEAKENVLTELKDRNQIREFTKDSSIRTSKRDIKMLEERLESETIEG